MVTEKLDGSNIGFFKLDGELLISTRNNIIELKEIEEVKQILYKGMYQWLVDNGEHLKDNLHEGSGVFGEWIGMGKIKYPNLDKKVYIFAKANINNKKEIYNLNYGHELFIYPFVKKEIPDYMGVVPVARPFLTFPTISDLNELYMCYTVKVDRSVEGFVVEYKNQVTKYVRMKNGSIEPHKENS